MTRYIVFDVETPNHRNDRISAIGITVVEGQKIVDSFFTLVNPETSFDDFNIQLTGISPEMVREAPTFPQLWARIEPLLSSGIPVAHNAVFDLGVLKKCLSDYGLFWKSSVSYLCTVQMGRSLLPGMSHKLNVLAEHYGIGLDHHQADSDSRACAEILLRYMEKQDSLESFYRQFTLSFPRHAQSKFQDAPETASRKPDHPRSPSEVVSTSSTILSAAESALPVCDLFADPNLEEAQKLLSGIYGYQAFRPGQETIIQSILQKKDILAVMPTGSGKSICYQIPALLLPGTTLVISPLISLMKDQVSALRNRGISVACLNSSMEDAEYSATARIAAQGACRILYVAPERLSSPGFLRLCGQMRIPFVAVDEAHCVSQWGQDFRPSYLKIADFIAQLPVRPVVSAFTATATPRVREDILMFLGLRDPVHVSTGFDRPNLSFSVYTPKDRDQTLADLLRDRFRQSGIVYCGTRKAVDSICEKLSEQGFPATRYHAGLDQEERARNQEDFLFDRKRVMVATNAFGMGIDKSNVSYVIHYNMPRSLEAYYQEAGRAGRDGCDADCILLYSPQDVIMARWLIDHTDPNPDLSPEEQENVREKDEERLKWMTFYARSRKCLRHDILRYFGEDAPENCGNCSNCVPDCEHVDITTEAQMILSCVARTDQRLPGENIVELLLGNIPDDLPEEISVQKLTTFGLMKDTPRQRLTEEIQALCDQGLLDHWEEDPRVLRLNQQSREVLFRNRRVAMRRNLKQSAKNQATEAKDLFQALQRLRYEISGKEHIAASTLLQDGTLREICRQLPRDKQQLAKVDGMGIFKANKYGEEILRLIQQYTPAGQASASANRPSISASKSSAAARKPSSAASSISSSTKGTRKVAKAEKQKETYAAFKDRLISEGKTEAYQPWTAEEDDQLKKEFSENMTLLEMAVQHKRTRGAILSRLKKLALV